MIGALYIHKKTNDIYVLLEMNTKTNEWFIFKNMRTFQERVLYGWANFYEYFKPITEEK